MRLLLAAAVLPCLLACRPAPASTSPAPERDPSEQASGSLARWSYTIALDEELERMQLGLCIEGPRPVRLEAGREAIGFVRKARVRGGPELARDGRNLVVETLGEHGCVDLEIDLDRAAAAAGRDTGRIGDALMLAPDNWLWYPARVPDQLEARARFELPEGLAATVPWPKIDGDDPQGWRSLDHTSFGWNAWIAFGRYEPIEFVAAQCEFEIAVLDGDLRASRAGLEAWIRAAAEAEAQLYGRFPRDRVAVVVLPIPAWGDRPVLFGMARRGGGGSVMLMIDDAAEDDALPGEWVALHELLHLGMPLVAEPWMSEGFVTYYTEIVRARAGLFDEGSQARAALQKLANGFENRSGPRTLAATSATMRQFGSYRRVYWGGAAIAFDLDLQLRRASGGRRSLDDLMLLIAPLAPEHRRFAADDLLARMDEEVARWSAAGELDREISPSQIAARHLESRVTPVEVQQLRGIAVTEDDGQIRLLADPIDEVALRNGLFVPKIADEGVREGGRIQP